MLLKLVAPGSGLNSVFESIGWGGPRTLRSQYIPGEPRPLVLGPHFEQQNPGQAISRSEGHFHLVNPVVMFSMNSESNRPTSWVTLRPGTEQSTALVSPLYGRDNKPNKAPRGSHGFNKMADDAYFLPGSGYTSSAVLPPTAFYFHSPQVGNSQGMCVTTVVISKK